MLTGSSPDVGRSLGLHYQFGDQPQRLILPPEILQMINEYIMGGRPDKPDYLESVPPQLCRVNSTWNRIFTPTLYAHYNFQGGINNLSSLYNFLHTLVHRPERTKMVQELTLTTWDIHEDLQFEPRSLRQTFLLLWRYTDIFDRCWAIRRLKQTDHDSLANRQAFKSFCATCLWSDGTIRTEWKEPLKAAYAVAHDKIHWLWLDPVLELVFGDLVGDLVMNGMVGHGKATGPAALASITQTPLTALIIALCPNLIRLNCDVWGVGEDPFFERIVRIATGSYPLPRAFRGKYRPMHKVESIQASGREMLVNPCYPSPSRGKTSISDYKNYWHLPRLKSLTILNAEMARDLKIRHSSTIEQLTLMGGSLQPHLPSLLSLTTNLRQLSLFIDVEYSAPPIDLDDDYGSGSDIEGLPTGPLQYSQIWTMLSHLIEQLEYLDLYQTALCPPSTSTSNSTSHTPPFFPTDDPRDTSAHIAPFCPPFTEFSKLRQLSIPLIGLYGHNCEHEPGTKFANHLPPSLESLSLYAHAENAPWTEQHFAPLDIELENIALSAVPTPTTSSPQNSNLKLNPHLRAIVGAEFQYNTKSNPQHKNKIYPFINHPAAKMDLAAKKAGIYCNVAGDRHMVFCGLMTNWGLMNCTLLRGSLGVLEKMDVGRIVPKGLSVYGVKGRL